MTDAIAPPVASIAPVPVESDVARRAETFTHDADLSWVVDLLTQRRAEILSRWLEAAADQPFHKARSERAIADHIPALFDALGNLLARHSDRSRNPGAPLDDPAVLEAAQSHARVRFQQGFLAPDVATEFRLLRQEIGRALRLYVSDRSPTTDVVGAELLVHDALDGAVFVALTALSEHEVARREAERALEAERKTAASEREAFFATLGHDLKSPLATAMAVTQQLRHQAHRGSLEVAHLADRLVDIESALRRGALRVDELMDLAHRDAVESRALHTESVDLGALVTEVLVAYRLTSDRHVLTLNAPSDPIVGEWDRDRIERAVDNLVSNAVKFSPDGGEVTAVISLASRGDVQEAVLMVTDQGRGIPADEHDAIFTQFQRGSNAADLPGSGVGLWSVRRIVKQHGGTLSVSSAVDAGSSFTMRLPLVALSG